MYWVHILWVVNTNFVMILHYWHLENLRNSTGGNSFYGAADMVLVPVFLYIIVMMLYPPKGEDGPVDFRDFYYENRAGFFGTWVLAWLFNEGALRAIVNQPLELDTLSLY